MNHSLKGSRRAWSKEGPLVRGSWNEPLGHGSTQRRLGDCYTIILQDHQIGSTTQTIPPTRLAPCPLLLHKGGLRSVEIRLPPPFAGGGYRTVPILKALPSKGSRRGAPNKKAPLCKGSCQRSW